MHATDTSLISPEWWLKSERERPADVLLCRPEDINVGGRGGGQGKIALDVGIICPQAAGHMDIASREVLGAAEEYARSKCERRDMAERCRAAGVVFQPKLYLHASRESLNLTFSL